MFQWFKTNQEKVKINMNTKAPKRTKEIKVHRSAYIPLELPEEMEVRTKQIQGCNMTKAINEGLRLWMIKMTPVGGGQ